MGTRQARIRQPSLGRMGRPVATTAGSLLERRGLGAEHSPQPLAIGSFVRLLRLIFAIGCRRWHNVRRNAGEEGSCCPMLYVLRTAPLFVLRPPFNDIRGNRLKHLRKRFPHQRLCLPKQQRDRTAWLVRFKPSASEADLRQSGVTAGWHSVGVLGGYRLRVCWRQRGIVGAGGRWGSTSSRGYFTCRRIFNRHGLRRVRTPGQLQQPYQRLQIWHVIGQ